MNEKDLWKVFKLKSNLLEHLITELFIIKA